MLALGEEKGSPEVDLPVNFPWLQEKLGVRSTFFSAWISLKWSISNRSMRRTEKLSGKEHIFADGFKFIYQ